MKIHFQSTCSWTFTLKMSFTLSLQINVITISNKPSSTPRRPRNIYLKTSKYERRMENYSRGRFINNDNKTLYELLL